MTSFEFFRKRLSRALQFSDQNSPEDESRTDKRSGSEPFVENDIRSNGGKYRFSCENQRRVGRACVALSPNQERIGNCRRKHSRDADCKNQPLSEMKPEWLQMREGR